MFEMVGLGILVAGIVVLAAGLIWITFRAFQTRVLWGLAVMFIPGAVFVFIARHYPKARIPLKVVLVGVLLMLVPYGMNIWAEHFIDLGPREKMVDGELHITLTGWDRTDYSVLQHRPKTVVLQMANPDVTDETLTHLRAMKELKELDLNDTQVTDAGLRTLGELPALAIVRLRKTQITEEGFRESLFAKESLRELDLRGTQVARATVSEWRKANPDRKALR